MELKMYRDNENKFIVPANSQLIQMEQIHEKQPIGGIPGEQNGISNPNGNLAQVLSHGRHSAWRQLTVVAIIFKIVITIAVLFLSIVLFTRTPQPDVASFLNPQSENLTTQGNETGSQDQQGPMKIYADVYNILYLSVAKKVWGLTLFYSLVQILAYSAVLYGIVKEILGLVYFWIVVLSIDIMGNVCGIVISLTLNELSATPAEAKMSDYPMGFFFLSLGLLVLNLLFLVWAKSFCVEVVFKQFVPRQGKEFYENKDVYLN